jgi:hypothetical protein
MEPKREKDRNGDDARHHGDDREEKEILSAMRIEHTSPNLRTNNKGRGVN